MVNSLYMFRHSRVSNVFQLNNPFTPKSDLIDFTLSNARRFYSSKGDPLGVKELKKILLPLDVTVSNARRFYSSKGDPLGVKGLKVHLCSNIK